MMTSILFSVVRQTRDFLAPLLSRFCLIVISKTEYENDAGRSASRGENPWCAHESIYSRLPSGLWLISDNQQQLLDLGVQCECLSYSDFCFTDNTSTKHHWIMLVFQVVACKVKILNWKKSIYQSIATMTCNEMLHHKHCNIKHFMTPQLMWLWSRKLWD